MARNVPGGRFRTANRITRKDFGEPSWPRTIAYELIVGIPAIVLYSTSWSLLFSEKVAALHPLLEHMWVRYALIGFLLGATVFARLWVQRRLYAFGLRVRGSKFDYRKVVAPSGDFAEMAMVLGPRFSVVVITGVLIAIGLVYAVAWPLVVLGEIALWADTHRPK